LTLYSLFAGGKAAQEETLALGQSRTLDILRCRPFGRAEGCGFSENGRAEIARKRHRNPDKEGDGDEDRCHDQADAWHQ